MSFNYLQLQSQVDSEVVQTPKLNSEKYAKQSSEQLNLLTQEIIDIEFYFVNQMKNIARNFDEQLITQHQRQMEVNNKYDFEITKLKSEVNRLNSRNYSCSVSPNKKTDSEIGILSPTSIKDYSNRQFQDQQRLQFKKIQVMEGGLSQFESDIAKLKIELNKCNKTQTSMLANTLKKSDLEIALKDFKQTQCFENQKYVEQIVEIQKELLRLKNNSPNNNISNIQYKKIEAFEKEISSLESEITKIKSELTKQNSRISSALSRRVSPVKNNDYEQALQEYQHEQSLENQKFQQKIEYLEKKSNSLTNNVTLIQHCEKLSSDFGQQDIQLKNLIQRLGSMEQSDLFQNFKKFKEQITKERSQQLLINANIFKKQEEQKCLLNQINEKLPSFISQRELENLNKCNLQEIETLCKQLCLGQFQQQQNEIAQERQKNKSEYERFRQINDERHQVLTEQTSQQLNIFKQNLQEQLDTFLLQCKSNFNVISEVKYSQQINDNTSLQDQINLLKSQIIEITDNKSEVKQQTAIFQQSLNEPKQNQEAKNAQMKQFQGKIKQILSNLQQIHIPNQIDKPILEQGEEQNFINPQCQVSYQEDISSEFPDMMMQSAIQQLEQLLMETQNEHPDKNRLQIVQGQINELYNLSNRKKQAQICFQIFSKEKFNSNLLHKHYDIKSSESKIKLAAFCNCYHQVREDGNSFYTAFGFQFFIILLTKYSDLEFQLFLQHMDQIITFNISYGQTFQIKQQGQFWNELKYRLQFIRNIKDLNQRMEQFLKHFSALEQSVDENLIDGCFYGLSIIFFRNLSNLMVEQSDLQLAIYDQYNLLIWEEVCNSNEVIMQEFSKFLQVNVKMLFFDKGQFSLKEYSSGLPHQIILLIQSGHYNVGLFEQSKQEFI